MPNMVRICHLVVDYDLWKMNFLAKNIYIFWIFQNQCLFLRLNVG